MKLTIDPPPASELIVKKPWLKTVGTFVLVASLALIVFDEYWKPYLLRLLLESEIEKPTAAYLVYLAGYIQFLGFAVGGYLRYKAREKPLYPKQEEI